MISLSETLRVSIANCEITRVGISSIQIYPMISSRIFRFLYLHDIQIIPFLLVTVVQPRRLGHAVGPGDLLRSAEASAAGASPGRWKIPEANGGF